MITGLESLQICLSGATRLAATCFTAAERKYFTCDRLMSLRRTVIAGNVFVNLSCNWSQWEFNNSSSRGGAEVEGLTPKMEQSACFTAFSSLQRPGDAEMGSGPAETPTVHPNSGDLRHQLKVTLPSTRLPAPRFPLLISPPRSFTLLRVTELVVR